MAFRIKVMVLLPFQKEQFFRWSFLCSEKEKQERKDRNEDEWFISISDISKMDSCFLHYCCLSSCLLKGLRCYVKNECENAPVRVQLEKQPAGGAETFKRRLSGKPGATFNHPPWWRGAARGQRLVPLWLLVIAVLHSSKGENCMMVLRFQYWHQGSHML